MAAMPRRRAASAARSSDGKSPCVSGMSTGCAPVSAAISRVRSVRLSRKLAAAQLLGIGRIDTDAEAARPQLLNRLLEVRKWRIGQATEIDDVGAGRPHGVRARDDRVDRQRGRVDDL